MTHHDTFGFTCKLRHHNRWTQHITLDGHLIGPRSRKSCTNCAHLVPWRVTTKTVR